mmetsp:Transcript_11623/g.34180  ORF Transcript_11623/g.34180 Transcript_11623/m.34180 type:complete len:227 (-) Transcript_11623:63-743(-)
MDVVQVAQVVLRRDEAEVHGNLLPPTSASPGEQVPEAARVAVPSTGGIGRGAPLQPSLEVLLPDLLGHVLQSDGLLARRGIRVDEHRHAREVNVLSLAHVTEENVPRVGIRDVIPGTDAPAEAHEGRAEERLLLEQPRQCPYARGVLDRDLIPYEPLPEHHRDVEGGRRSVLGPVPLDVIVEEEGGHGIPHGGYDGRDGRPAPHDSPQTGFSPVLKILKGRAAGQG